MRGFRQIRLSSSGVINAARYLMDRWQPGSFQESGTVQAASRSYWLSVMKSAKYDSAVEFEGDYPARLLKIITAINKLYESISNNAGQKTPTPKR